MSNALEEGPLAPGRIVHGRVIGHEVWGIELELEEAEAFGTVDILFLSDDTADMNPERYPPLGTRLCALVQGMTPSGQLRLTIRKSDLKRAGIKISDSLSVLAISLCMGLLLDGVLSSAVCTERHAWLAGRCSEVTGSRCSRWGRTGST